MVVIIAGIKNRLMGKRNMPSINIIDKIIKLKIIYYGPERGGKTTTVKNIHKFYGKKLKSSFETVMGDDLGRTLFCDVLNFEMPGLDGYSTNINLISVPGQKEFADRRKLLLRDIDGVIFVADLMMLQRDKNILSLKELQNYLLQYGKSIYRIPICFQYNKKDLRDTDILTISPSDLNRILNSKLKAPFYETCALKGENIVNPVKKVMKMAMKNVYDDLKKVV